MPDHLAHGFAARGQIGARIEGFGALRKQGPDGGGDGQPQIRINIDLANGGSGEVSNWLAEDEYFSVNAITMSGNDGKEDASTLRISVVFRNEDGSLTEALCQIKPDCVDLIK